MVPERFRLLTIKEIVSLSDKKLLEMPEFQRNLVWKPIQAAALMNSIIADSTISQIYFWKLKEGEKIHIRRHGSSVAVAQNEEVLILDGQQRITALSVIVGNNTPSWCDPTDKKIAAIKDKVCFNFVTCTFEVRNFRNVPGESSIPASYLFSNVQDSILADMIKRLSPVGTTAIQMEIYADTARLAREKVLAFTVSVETREMGLDAAHKTFEAINSGGTKLNDTDLLLAAISGHAPGLAVGKINPFAKEMGGLVNEEALRKAVVRTLIVTAMYRSNSSTTSRLTKIDFTDIKQSIWEKAWADTEKAWRVVFNRLACNGIDPSALPGLNPVVPLALFAVRFPEMYQAEMEKNMVALYLLCLRTERFAKHSTDPHEEDASTIFNAPDGMTALCDLRDEIVAVYARDNRGAKPYFEAKELLEYTYTDKNYALFHAAWTWQKDAVDWLTGTRLKYTKDGKRSVKTSLGMQFHHVCALSWARKSLGAEIADKDKIRNPKKDQLIDSMANIVMVSEGTNNSFSDKAPAVALADVLPERLEQQLAKELAEADTLANVRKLIEERANKMAAPDEMNWFLTHLDDLLRPGGGLVGDVVTEASAALVAEELRMFSEDSSSISLER